MGVTAESWVGWTIAGGWTGVAGSWLAGDGTRDAKPHGSADFIANACPNVVFGLAFPAVGAPIFPRLPGRRLNTLHGLCGLASSITLALAAALPLLRWSSTQ